MSLTASWPFLFCLPLWIGVVNNLNQRLIGDREVPQVHPQNGCSKSVPGLVEKASMNRLRDASVGNRSDCERTVKPLSSIRMLSMPKAAQSVRGTPDGFLSENSWRPSSANDNEDEIRLGL